MSGPGAHSQRTDGKPNVQTLDNAKYGEAKNFQEIQGGAPMGPGPSAPAAAPAGGAAPQMPTPLTAPTQDPNMPVTAGADAGPGPGSSALGIPSQAAEVQDLRARYGPILPTLIRKASDPRTSQQFKDQVRYLISVIT